MKTKIRMTPGACFDRGQRITEVGAALAYAEYHAARIPGAGLRELQDVSSGLHTAAVMAERLVNELGQSPNKGEAVAIAKNLKDFNLKVRKQIGSPDPIKPEETLKIQRQTALFRKQATKIWNQIRKTCEK